MALLEFNDLPDKSTPFSAKNVNFNFKEVLNLVFPVGRGFIDFTETDYSNYLGFTWERELVGLTPVGYNKNDEDFNKIGKTGGSKDLQSHSHAGITLWGNSDKYLSLSGGNKSTAYCLTYKDNALEGDLNSLQTGFAGNGDSGNLQPYKVVAYWKRIA